MRVILRSASPRQLALFSLVFADSVLGLADRRAHAPKYFVLCVRLCSRGKIGKEQTVPWQVPTPKTIILRFIPALFLNNSKNQCGLPKVVLYDALNPLLPTAPSLLKRM